LNAIFLAKEAKMRYPKILYAGAIIAALAVAPVNQAGAAVFKIATLSPDGSFWMEKMREGAREVAQRTENRVQFKYYPGGVMGDDKAVLRKMRIGQLQGGTFVAGSLSEFFPGNQLYGLPMVFSSLAEVEYVRSRMDPLIIEGLEKGGIVSFGIAEGGFAYVMSKRPINSIKDLTYQKVWAPADDLASLKAVGAFGITPIPLSLVDVRTGLQTGMIDTVATSPIGAIVLQWYTQVNYLLELPLLYIHAAMGVSRRDFERLSPGDQAVTRAVMGRVFKEIDRQNRLDNVSAMETLRTQGIRFIQPSAEEAAEWALKGAAARQKLTWGKEISPEFMAAFKRHLDAFQTTQRKNYQGVVRLNSALLQF
jgi:TRAP-type C4-dicarboxylate transport system substrate-binding protein